jgi:aspartate aminotransferase
MSDQQKKNPSDQRIARRTNNVSESKTVAISNLAGELARQGKNVISLSVGEPDFDAPAPVLEAVKKAADQGKTKYTDSAGIPPLRERLSEKFQETNDVDYGPDQIVVTSGAKHAIYLALQAVLDPDDPVLIPSPYWVSYPEMVKSIGGEPVVLDTSLEEDYKITPEQVREHGEQAELLILNSPSNPTGTVYTPEEIEAITEEALRQDLLLLSDEIYEEFIYGDLDPLSPASISDEAYEQTITINGFSKAYAMTGLRVGYVAGPQDLLDAVGKLQTHTTTHASSVAQWGALAALGVSDDELSKNRKTFRNRRELVARALDDMPGVSVTAPQGAFYIFPDISELYDGHFDASSGEASVDFCRELLEETGLALVPGTAFGADGGVRISYAASREELTDGMSRMSEFISNLS